MKISAILVLIAMLPNLVAAQMDSADAVAAYKRSTNLFMSRQIEAGLATLDTAIRAFKENKIYDMLAAAENDKARATFLTGGNLLDMLDACERIEKEILIKLPEGGEMHAKTYFHIGNAYYQMAQIVQAKDYLMKADAIMATLGEKYNYRRAGVLGSLANIAAQMNSAELSIAYTRQAIRLLEDARGVLHPSTARQRVNLVKTLISIEDVEGAEKIVEELNRMKPQLDADDHDGQAQIYEARAYLQRAQGNVEGAFATWLTIENEHPQALLPENQYFEWVSKKSDLLTSMGRVDEAERILLSSLGDPRMEPQLNYLYRAIHDFYMKQGLPTPATHYAKLFSDLYMPGLNESPEVVNDLTIGLDFTLKGIMMTVAAADALADSTGLMSHRVEVLERVKYAESLFRVLRRKADVGELMNLREKGWYDVYDRGVKTAAILYNETKAEQYLSAAWTIIENAKSAALLSSMNRQSPFAKGGVPEGLLVRERELKKELAFYRSQQSENQHLTAEQRYRFIAVNESLDSLVTTYETEFPEYTNERFSPDPAALSEAISYASAHKGEVWSYFFGESGVYGLSISAKSASFKRLGSPDSLLKSIGAYREMINKRPDIQSFSRQMKEMVAQSKMLYATLVAPLLSSDGLPAHLLLIPDGPINYVPFEAFVIDTPPGNQIPDYMVNHTDVAYSYGFTLQGLHRVSQNDFKHSLLAVAPLFLAGKAAGNNDNNGNWQPIEGALEEVKAVTALFPSHIARVEEENHAWFMNNLGNFNVLHLATHAFANEQNPFESGLLLDGGSHAGQKGVLTVSDLYHTSLPTELVVLSACNTGFGPVKRGEGVVSLAHGFAYAGSPAVAMALWPANDQTTRMVVTQFYKTLLEGNTKSNALTAAKRNYLRDADVYKGHPYFWAGMVFIGLNDPLTLSASFPWFWGVLIFCTACLGVFFLIRRLQRSRAV